MHNQLESYVEQIPLLKTHGSYIVTGSVGKYGPYSSMAHTWCAICNSHMNQL